MLATVAGQFNDSQNHMPLLDELGRRRARLRALRLEARVDDPRWPTNSLNSTGRPSPRAKLISAVTPTDRCQPSSISTSSASARCNMQRSTQGDLKSAEGRTDPALSRDLKPPPFRRWSIHRLPKTMPNPTDANSLLAPLPSWRRPPCPSLLPPRPGRRRPRRGWQFAAWWLQRPRSGSREHAAA